MVIQRTPTKIDKIVSLRIGQHQENAATQIKMDVSDWITVHPTAGFHILFKRPGEVQAQPVLSSLEEGILTWTVQEWETSLIGVGYAEVRAIEAESALVAKSRVIPCSIEDSIIEDGEVPPEFSDWPNQVLGYKDAAIAAADSAEKSAGVRYEATWENQAVNDAIFQMPVDFPDGEIPLIAIFGPKITTYGISYGPDNYGDVEGRTARNAVSVTPTTYREVTQINAIAHYTGTGAVRLVAATGAEAAVLKAEVEAALANENATDASASQISAAGSATNAAASATAAAASAGNAETSERNAAASARSASVSESNASTSASNASPSASMVMTFLSSFTSKPRFLASL